MTTKMKNKIKLAVGFVGAAGASYALIHCQYFEISDFLKSNNENFHLYTADKSISGINIAIATDPRIATTLIGSLFQTNKPIVINTIIIEIILESILYPPIYFYFKSLPSQHPSISRAHILTCRLHMATFYPLRLPDSP